MSSARQETLTRLIGYGCSSSSPLPPTPTEIIPLPIFEDLMYRVASSGGYSGTKAEFKEVFADRLNSSTNYYEGLANDNETNEETIKRILKDIIPKKDDIFILKRVIADDKISFTAFVFDGVIWRALDGNYDSKNIYFSKDLVVTENIGTIKIDDSGSHTIEAAGKSVDEVLRYILAKEINPTITMPEILINFINETNVEAGTEITPTYNAKLTSGNYEYGPETGINALSWNIVDNSIPQNSSNLPSDSFPSIIIEDNTIYKITATALYNDGNIPKTNIGNDYLEGQIKSNSISKTITTAISSYRNFFYGAINSSTSEAPLTSELIRSLNKGGAYNEEKIITINAKNAKRIIIAYPADSTREGLKSALLTSSMNLNITSLYKEKFNIRVSGANGYKPILYKVFVYEPAELDSNEIHQIKLA